VTEVHRCDLLTESRTLEVLITSTMLYWLCQHAPAVLYAVVYLKGARP